MASKIQHCFKYMALMAICLISLMSFSRAQLDGTATFYDPPYTPSKCYGDSDQGVMIGSASDAFWNDGEACGKFYQVNCLSGTNQGTPNPCLGSSTVTVKIVDRCGPDCRGTIDLSQEAFASIADTNAGVINVSYQQV